MINKKLSPTVGLVVVREETLEQGAREEKRETETERNGEEGQGRLNAASRGVTSISISPFLSISLAPFLRGELGFLGYWRNLCHCRHQRCVGRSG